MKTAAEVIASPALKTALTVSAEDLAAFNARRADELNRRNAFKVQDLRRTWQAPHRHVTTQPKFSGEWGKKFDVLRAKMNEGSGMSVALVGERGNGKTQLAVELMRVATSQLKSALFVTAMGFFIAVKTSYRRDSEKTEQTIMTLFGKPRLLVIDEIGKRSDSEWENNMLFELLNRSYNDMKDIILICNKKKAEFEDYIGPSIASRMNETGGIIECNWPTFRT